MVLALLAAAEDGKYTDLNDSIIGGSDWSTYRWCWYQLQQQSMMSSLSWMIHNIF